VREAGTGNETGRIASLVQNQLFISRESRQHVLDHAAVDVGEAVVSALEPVGEPGVVQAQQVQDRRLDVVNMHWVFNDVETELVGRAQGETRLEATASHEHRVGERVVVATQVGAGRGAALAKRGAAELTHPDHQRLIQEAPTLQVHDQCGDGPVHLRAAAHQVVADVFPGVGPVKVPAPIEELDEPHTFLDQATREQAVVREAGCAGCAP